MQAHDMARTANNWQTPGASDPGRYSRAREEARARLRSDFILRDSIASAQMAHGSGARPAVVSHLATWHVWPGNPAGGTLPDVCVCESREYLAGRMWLVWACDVTSSNSHLIFPLQVKFFFLTKFLSLSRASSSSSLRSPSPSFVTVGNQSQFCPKFFSPPRWLQIGNIHRAGVCGSG